MTPDHDPAFVFSDCPASAKVAARRIANAPAHTCLFIIESSPTYKPNANLEPSGTGFSLWGFVLATIKLHMLKPVPLRIHCGSEYAPTTPLSKRAWHFHVIIKTYAFAE
jgi:hypothetical protein